MGRWSELSNLIDFHFEHGHGGKAGVNVTTRYHKLDDSIIVLCRNCGHSTKNDSTKKMDGNAAKLPKNPKHFLTWSATAANNRLQKMSKTLANNITRLQLKMEKAIPFQQGLAVGGSSCESGKLHMNESCCSHDQIDNNNGHQYTTSPDIVNVNMSKVNNENEEKKVNQLGEIGKQSYDTRVIQSARIVQSHPSVSQIHSQGSVANPDKIIQIDIDSYRPYSPEEVDSLTRELEKAKETSVDFNVQSETVDETQKKSDKILDMQPLDLFSVYDSGTGSANTSISGSSMSSPSVSDSSLKWSRATKILATNPNNQKRGHDIRNNKSGSSSTSKFSGILMRNNKGYAPKKETPDSNNSTNNSGASIIESTDETSLLIAKNKSSHKRGLRNGKNVEIFNKKNSVGNNKNGNLERPTASSTSLRLKSLVSQLYPPSKLAVTIFEKEGELRHAPWFQAGMPREIALEILRNELVGSFIVRESTTKSGCFALSLRVPKECQPCGIAHYLILKSSRGYKIKGFTKLHKGIWELITHHSVMAELLPTNLDLSQYQTQQKTPRVSRANSSDFMEADKIFIGTFTDF